VIGSRGGRASCFAPSLLPGVLICPANRPIKPRPQRAPARLQALSRLSPGSLQALSRLLSCFTTGLASTLALHHRHHRHHRTLPLGFLHSHHHCRQAPHAAPPVNSPRRAGVARVARVAPPKPSSPSRFAPARLLCLLRSGNPAGGARPAPGLPRQAALPTSFTSSVS
jgi:hypothetical protein